jgi:hypothetical protein
MKVVFWILAGLFFYFVHFIKMLTDGYPLVYSIIREHI